MSSPGWTDKIVLLIPRLASDSDGEVLATVAAIRRVLKSNGGDLHDLAKAIGSPQAQPSGRGMHDDMRDAQRRAREAYERTKRDSDFWGPYAGVDFDEVVTLCEEKWNSLSPREIDFVGSVKLWMQSKGRPTDKQASWLMDIYHRIGGKQ